MSEFAGRLLDFPVRTAAIEEFRRQLRAKRLGDLSAVAAALGDAGLFAALIELWIGREWIVRSPSSPLYAFPGERFSTDLTLEDLCGAGIGYDAPVPEPDEKSEGEA